MDELTFKLTDLHGQVTLNDNNDPDANFFNQNNVETKCFSPTNFTDFFFFAKAKT